MGEAKRRQKEGLSVAAETVSVETAGGRIQVRWDDDSAATPFGQMAFFIEFLTLTGLFDKWVESCPLDYQGPHASSKRDILGTWLIAILSGHRRYSHITTIRADGVTPGLLGMARTVSEDTVRRALSAIAENGGEAWLQTQLDASIQPLLSTPWIWDVDVTVKSLYGKQEGAEVGYNPKKLGRPSHAYHTHQMSGLRLILGVDVEPGNESNAIHTLPGILRRYDALPSQQRPYLIRGDIAFGNERVMKGLEDRSGKYLFKLRLTKNVKRYINQIFWSNEWEDAGQGWQGRHGELTLTGWSRARRVVVLRRQLIGEILLADEARQLELAFVETDVPAKRYEYAVLVTNVAHDIRATAQLYRDRADSENTFDELKNQWGWGGFTTSDLDRCKLSAMGVALIYNWWSLFVRLAHPKARMEAITSRPLLLTGVARMTQHAGQQHLAITPIHGNSEKAATMLTDVSRRLKEWKRSAEQLLSKSVWLHVCDYVSTQVTGIHWISASEIQRLPAPETG